MNMSKDSISRSDQDPLGLADLPLLEPDQDGWAEIRQALEQQPARPKAWARTGGWLAMAASVVLVAGIFMFQSAPQQETATPATQVASLSEENTLGDLITMSQLLETRLRGLRDETSGMPAQSAVYIAELEDMIARVDGELSYSSESVDLWGQRVNLLLDLEMIFQHQFDREYGRMASL